MTIDQAIAYLDEAVKAQCGFIPCAGCCFGKCKEFNKQLAEWLRELRSYKEKQEKGYKLCNVNEAIEKMTELKEQEDKGICFYNPPYYSERCIEILKGASKWS